MNKTILHVIYIFSLILLSSCSNSVGYPNTGYLGYDPNKMGVGNLDSSYNIPFPPSASMLPMGMPPIQPKSPPPPPQPSPNIDPSTMDLNFHRQKNTAQKYNMRNYPYPYPYSTYNDIYPRLNDSPQWDQSSISHSDINQKRQKANIIESPNFMPIRENNFPEISKEAGKKYTKKPYLQKNIGLAERFGLIEDDYFTPSYNKNISVDDNSNYINYDKYDMSDTKNIESIDNVDSSILDSLIKNDVLFNNNSSKTNKY